MDELCGPPEEAAAGQLRLKTSAADDEWILVDKSSTYFIPYLHKMFYLFIFIVSYILYIAYFFIISYILVA